MSEDSAGIPALETDIGSESELGEVSPGEEDTLTGSTKTGLLITGNCSEKEPGAAAATHNGSTDCSDGPCVTSADHDASPCWVDGVTTSGVAGCCARLLSCARADDSVGSCSRCS